MRLAIILLALLAFWPQPIFADDDGKLLKVVVLTRHGLRAPTQDGRILAMWSQKKWPEWPVGRGELTPRGARLVTDMWSSLAKLFTASGTLPPAGCPGKDDVYVRADTDERTRMTARALLDGLAPECRLAYRVAETDIDPLFHPVRAGLYHYDAILAASQVLASTNGGLERLQDEFSGTLALLGNISGPPSANLCARFALMPDCALSDLPNAVSISPDGGSIRLVGSLGIASSMAEIFLLEYGQWPDQAAGWGEVNASILSQLMPVHTKIFDVVNRTPLVAWANGGALLAEMTAALMGEHDDQALNLAKLVVFVGHDTNIANISGLLGLYWQPSGYPPNGAPPAGAMFLELWQKDGEQKVIARFYSQTPQALHTPFTDNQADAYAPKRAAVFFGGDQSLATMRAQAFRALVRKVTENAPKTRERQQLVEITQ